jgi:hypothetical protein
MIYRASSWTEHKSDWQTAARLSAAPDGQS